MNVKRSCIDTTPMQTLLLTEPQIIHLALKLTIPTHMKNITFALAVQLEMRYTV
jgi:hypothetical protein